MQAFQAGRFSEAEKMLKEHEAITKTRFGIGDMALRGGQLDLQRQRFGQVEQPLAEASIASSEERIKSSEQQRDLTEFDVRDRRRLEEENAELRAEIAKQQQAKGTTTTGAKAGTLISQQEAAKTQADVTTKFAEKREQSEINLLDAKAAEERAARQAKLTEEERLRDSLRRATDAEGKPLFTPDDINNIMAQGALTKVGVARTVESISKDITILTSALSQLSAKSVTVEQVKEGVAGETGSRPSDIQFLAGLFGVTKGELTPEQRDLAVSKVTALRDALIDERNAIPGATPITLEKEVKDKPLGETLTDIEGIIANLQTQNRTRLSTPESESLTQRGLGAFIPFINDRLRGTNQ